jgi:hypothetical protein
VARSLGYESNYQCQKSLVLKQAFPPLFVRGAMYLFSLVVCLFISATFRLHENLLGNFFNENRKFVVLKILFDLYYQLSIRIFCLFFEEKKPHEYNKSVVILFIK